MRRFVIVVVVVFVSLSTLVTGLAAPGKEGFTVLPWSLYQRALHWQVMAPGGDVPEEELMIFCTADPTRQQLEQMVTAGYTLEAVVGRTILVSAPITLYIDQEQGLDALGFVSFVSMEIENRISLQQPLGMQGWSDMFDTAAEEAIGHLQPNEAIFEYMVTDSGLYLSVITREGIGEPIFAQYSRDQLMNDVVDLRKTLQSEQPDQITLTLALSFLYDKLVKPGLCKLADGVDTLVIIPSGPLWYLPFSALMMSDTTQQVAGSLGTRYPYLVEKFTLAYLPSLLSLPNLIISETDEGGSFLGFIGSSEVDGFVIEDSRLITSIHSLGQCLVEDGVDASTYVGTEATESRLIAECSNARFLLLMCPVRPNSYVPWQSNILLAEDEENNGELHAREALELDLRRTELVMLPGVETLLPALRQLQDTLFKPELPEEARYAVSHGNTGIHVDYSQEGSEGELAPELLKKLVMGEDVTVWPLAFLSAGAKAVLQTLWAPNVHVFEHTLETICSSYWEGIPWAQVLRAAQLELIHDNVFNPPWFWAPYQLIGRWR